MDLPGCELLDANGIGLISDAYAAFADGHASVYRGNLHPVRLVPAYTAAGTTGLLRPAGWREVSASVDAQGVTLESFAKTLRLVLDLLVISQPGLAGRFDIKVEFSREGTALAGMPLAGRQSSDTTPSIFTVLQEKLGLKFESGKGPVDQFVIGG